MVTNGLGRGVGCDEAEFELHPDLVSVATGDSSANRWLFVVTDGDPVARLRIECLIGQSRAVADPGLDHEVRANRCGVVPQVVSVAVHVAHDTSIVSCPVARVGNRAFEVGPNSIKLCRGGVGQNDSPVWSIKSRQQREAAVDKGSGLSDE